jgi:hypothetical protein
MRRNPSDGRSSSWAIFAALALTLLGLASLLHERRPAPADRAWIGIDGLTARPVTSPAARTVVAGPTPP